MQQQIFPTQTSLSAYICKELLLLSNHNSFSFLIQTFHSILKSCTSKQHFIKNYPQHLLILQSLFSSANNTQSEQNLGPFRNQICSKFGQYFQASCHIVCNLSTYNMLPLEQNQDFEKQRKEKASGLSKTLQKLRFQIEIQNMNRTMEGNIPIDYEDVVKSIFMAFSSDCISSAFYQILLESIKNQNSNISQQLSSQIIKILNNSGMLEEKSCPKSQDGSNSKSSSALTYLKKRQLEIQRIEKQQARPSKTLFNHNSESKWLKTKQIFKPRTIYHSRKNTFTSKKTQETMLFDKYESFDKSTEWSFPKSGRRSNPSINDDDFDDEMLVPKTPKVSNLNFEVRPISVHLDFSD